MFTDRAIKALPVTGKTYRKHEGASDPGFGIQVSSGGAKTFFQHYRSADGKARFFRLGTYPETSLAQARQAARETRKLLDQRIDPREYYEARHKAKEKAEREARMRGSVQQLFEAYIEHLKSRSARSWREVQRSLYKDAIPALGANTKAAEVDPEDVSDCIAKVVTRGAKTYANRLRAYMHAAFEYGLDEFDPVKRTSEVRFGLKKNPVARIKINREAERQGETALDWDEIVFFWTQIGKPYTDTKSGRMKRVNWQAQRALKLMVALGGQRAVDVLRIQQKNINLAAGIIELESSETKNNRWHVVPIHPLAQTIIEETMAFNGPNSTLLFPAKSDPKATRHVALTTLGHDVRAWWQAMSKKHSIQRFTPRDLRRTCKTRMGELGIEKEHRDRLQNHALQDVSSRHYDRYDYLAEKRTALHIWGDHLERLIKEGSTDTLRVSLATLETA